MWSCLAPPIRDASGLNPYCARGLTNFKSRRRERVLKMHALAALR